jgi:hypothetical protein
VVGASQKLVIAYSTSTCGSIWQKEMCGNVWSIRIHGSVLVVPVNDSETAVLDVSTGQLTNVLPSKLKDIDGICVFDGLKTMIDVFYFYNPTLLSQYH